MIRILIADDHAILRAGLRQIVAEAGDIEVAGEAANGADLLDLLRRQECDAVILDLSMPGRGGIDVLPRIKAEKPQLPVLVLSTYPEEQYAVRLIRAGASGYLNKESAPELLVQAIRQIARGNRFITPAVAEMLANQVAGANAEDASGKLSNREYEVLRLLGSGKSISEVAEMLALSVKTVSTYRARLLEKLGLNTSADLIRYAIEHGISV